eukprot:Mycagemm_TRINITY_DN10330_c1_g12::TRINITY_DN10330_c1_g12_i1::g.1148::m.1148 type:complete len:136 gc:universal TRINITY_DN10330_c1_g12_i1:419-12(-)
MFALRAKMRLCSSSAPCTSCANTTRFFSSRALAASGCSISSTICRFLDSSVSCERIFSDSSTCDPNDSARVWWSMRASIWPFLTASIVQRSTLWASANDARRCSSESFMTWYTFDSCCSKRVKSSFSRGLWYWLS